MLLPWLLVHIISIHALREESDFILVLVVQSLCLISIHALREESDFRFKLDRGEVHRFQSTLSVRRATRVYNLLLPLCCISIHALREESDKFA